MDRMASEPSDPPQSRLQPFLIELVQLLGSHLESVGGSVEEPAIAETFLASLTEPLASALEDDALLRGIGTEELFFAMVAELGAVRLIKQEDSGRLWSRQAGVRIPDYRIVLPDESQFLVEVKHYYQPKS